MKVFIRDIDEKLLDIYGARKKKLLEIFDRGGYSKEFCVGIDNSIRFLCWRSDAKHAPKTDEGKWAKVLVSHQGNTIHKEKKPQIYYGWERIVEFEVGKKKAKFREVWIRRVEIFLLSCFTFGLSTICFTPSSGSSSPRSYKCSSL